MVILNIMELGNKEKDTVMEPLSIKMEKNNM
jgi:hypothetical protein